MSFHAVRYMPGSSVESAVPGIVEYCWSIIDNATVCVRPRGHDANLHEVKTECDYINCPNKAPLRLSARHGKQLYSCLSHAGQLISQLWQHDSDSINVEWIKHS